MESWYFANQLLLLEESEMNAAQRLRLIWSKNQEIREWASKALEIQKNERLHIVIEVESLEPRPKIRIDKEYVLTEDDWELIDDSRSNNPSLQLDRYLVALVQDKVVQFPACGGSILKRIQRHFRNEKLPFRLRCLVRSYYFPDREYRLYKIITE